MDGDEQKIKSQRAKTAQTRTELCSFLLSPIRDITEGKPLQLEVTGIEYMNDDPAMVDVLYAKVGVQDGSDK